MENLLIEPTTISPEVKLLKQEQIIKIKGVSRPENPKEFYTKLINWVIEFDKYLYFINTEFSNNPRPIILDLHFDYLNSSSIKYLFDFLKTAIKLNDISDNLKVKWTYNKGDELMKENGIEFSLFLDVEIEIIEFEK